MNFWPRAFSIVIDKAMLLLTPLEPFEMYEVNCKISASRILENSCLTLEVSIFASLAACIIYIVPTFTQKAAGITF